jgi:hypothetical protein
MIDVYGGLVLARRLMHARIQESDRQLSDYEATLDPSELMALRKG